MRLPFAAIACLCLALFVPVTFAQPKKAKPASAEEADAEAAQQRTVAISLVITLADEAASLKEIYDYNPLLFDFVLKRRLRLPGTSRRFPATVFMTNSGLGA